MNKPVLPTEVDFDDFGPLYAAQKKVYPQRVSGTFRRIKWGLMAFCLGVYYLLPFVRWNRGLGAPDQAVLVDLPNSRFYFFFIELWPQEVYYFTGLLIVAAITLFLMNSLGGRIWCGYLCPQTVWTDLFFWTERLFEGECRGRLASERRGVRGFGYDPAFIPEDLPPGAAAGTTMAELSEDEKDAISHRGRAVRALAEWLRG